MKSFRLAVSLVIALGGFGLLLTPVSAKPEYSKKEKTGCLTCHTAIKSKDLNETGKCYGDKKSLTECKK